MLCVVAWGYVCLVVLLRSRAPHYFPFLVDGKEPLLCPQPIIVDLLEVTRLLQTLQPLKRQLYGVL